MYIWEKEKLVSYLGCLESLKNQLSLQIQVQGHQSIFFTNFSVYSHQVPVSSIHCVSTLWTSSKFFLLI